MLANGVKETTTTTGAGTVTLSSVTGRVRFSQAFPIVGQLVNYSIKSGDNLEWGIGTVGASNTLARTVVLGTLVSGTLTTVGATAITLAGTSDVLCTDYDQARLSACPAAYSGYILSAHYAYNGAQYGGTLTSNRQYFIPFRMDYTKSVNALAAQITTAVASTKFRLGIYSVKTDGLPGFLIAQTADMDSTTTGFKTASITQTRFPPGWYYVSMLANGAVGVLDLGFTYANPTVLGVSSTDAILQGQAYADITAGWTVLGDPAPSVTLANNVATPLIVMGVAA